MLRGAYTARGEYDRGATGLEGMRGTLLLAACAGCAAHPAPAAHTPAAHRPEAQALDDAAARQRAHAFFDSVDRRDKDRFRRLITSGFVLFEDGSARPAAKLSRWWAESNARGKPPRTRTCTDEAVHRSATAVVYVADCKEHDPRFGDRPAQDWKGYNTVVLVPDRGAWRVALWQWQDSGIEAERTRWNDAYRRGVAFTKKPNRLLERSVRGVKPGRALDLAMGQGRNALYLASRGWNVTGVDLSDEGIRQARDAAKKLGVSLDAVLADIDEYDFGTDRWDLVTMVYAGSSKQWMERIKPSLRRGGLFVFEFFYKAEDEDTETWRGTDAATLASAFAGWEILEQTEVEDVPDWGKRKVKLVRFVARKP
jgi:SAM-dependent methyltransferase